MENLRDVDYVYIMNPLIHNDDTIDFIDHNENKWTRENGDLPKGIILVMVVIEQKQPPENDVCNSYGIDSVWGLGDKVQSSSWLLEKYLNISE